MSVSHSDVANTCLSVSFLYVPQCLSAFRNLSATRRKRAGGDQESPQVHQAHQTHLYEDSSYEYWDHSTLEEELEQLNDRLSKGLIQLDRNNYRLEEMARKSGMKCDDDHETPQARPAHVPEETSDKYLDCTLEEVLDQFNDRLSKGLVKLDRHNYYVGTDWNR